MNTPATQPARSVTDLTFAEVNGVTLQLDVHLPSADGPPPLVVYFHGGGWQNGDKAGPNIAYLLEHGYAVASVNYRLTHQACFPAQIHDCKAAIRYLRAHAGELGYRVDKLVVTGSSAGGHLVSLLGTTNRKAEYEGALGEHLDVSSHVDAVVNFFGPQDFLLRAKTQPGQVLPEGSIVWKLLGGAFDERIELARQASPALQVDANTVPFLILHGDADQQVQMDQQEQLAASLQLHGIAHRLIIAPGLVHGDARFYQPPYREPVLKFLREVWGHAD